MIIAGKLLTHFGITFDRRTGADQVSITVRIVDLANTWPEFIFTYKRKREGRFFTGVRMIPIRIMTKY